MFGRAVPNKFFHSGADMQQGLAGRRICANKISLWRKYAARPCRAAYLCQQNLTLAQICSKALQGGVSVPTKHCFFIGPDNQSKIIRCIPTPDEGLCRKTARSTYIIEFNLFSRKFQKGQGICRFLLAYE
jgi:hypothetical protein